MKYPHDQREWVKAADENVPKYLAEASRLQNEAASAFVDWQEMPATCKLPYLQQHIAGIYAEARMYLFRALYYSGMREANKEQGVE